jgi:hypothetical protein
MKCARSELGGLAAVGTLRREVISVVSAASAFANSNDSAAICPSIAFEKQEISRPGCYVAFRVNVPVPVHRLQKLCDHFLIRRQVERTLPHTAERPLIATAKIEQ